MSDHPIEGLMTTAMQSIRDMVDVNTIVGDAVETPDGTVIIPISKVSFGFASGGGEYGACCDTTQKAENEEDAGQKGKFPFAGGSGAGVSINPIAFMVVGQGQIKLMPVAINSSVDKVLDLVPGLLDKVNDTLKKRASSNGGSRENKNSGDKTTNTVCSEEK